MDKNMDKTTVFIEGSFFCEKCNREYEKKGICECGRKIEFISMHSNRYLNIWMKSKDKDKVKGGEIDMSLDDKRIKDGKSGNNIQYG